MSVSETISIDLNNGESIELEILADNPGSLEKISDGEAENHLEAPLQLTEGFQYEYQLSKGFYFKETDQYLGLILSPSKKNPSNGRLYPNTWVGTLHLEIQNEKKEICGTVDLEIRSIKTEYRDEYRLMLEEITEKCTDLLMQYTSPVNQPFNIEHDKDPQTLYQRFAFLKSVLDSEEFASAVHRVVTNPVTEWMQTEEKKDIRSVRRVNRHVVRQLAGSSKRVNLPEHHKLRKYMESVPEKVITRGKVDSVDTPENRFIKYALETFKNLCSDFKNHAENNTRLYREAEFLEEELEESLNHALFQKISRPATLPLNSPVLQRKEGYREILRVWLMVNLAARLTWDGGEDVYKGGKRDVATLYEYWLFFKLTDLLEDLFDIQALTPEKLIEETDDKLGLKLKQGKHLPLQGIYESESRSLHVEFSFNKTFSGDKNYPTGGSWTRSMRPDYTLSIWPVGISKTKANEEELIVHLHFDAKYKVEHISSLFGADERDLDEEGRQVVLDQEKQEQKQGTFKRADLLKMHAYKDAIRRTAGAYILYPGSIIKNDWKGFHEIVPGLGAFTMKPNSENNGSSELRNFLKDVIQHFLNRASQREKYSFQTYRTFKSRSDDEINEPLPEPYGLNRSMIPDETYVMVGFYKGEDHYNWIKNEGLYNARAGSIRGSLQLSRGETEASFILIHSYGELITNKLFKVKSDGPKVFSKRDLLEKKYPGEKDEKLYLVYEIEENPHEELKDIFWDVRKLEGFKGGRGSALPFSVTLSELMKAKS